MMGDLMHDLNVLVLVAKNDSTISEHHSELARIPEQLSRVEREFAKVEAAEKKSLDDFEAKRKERRQLEVALQDNEVKIKKIKDQLMSANSNKEYQAFLKEIELLEGSIDTEEVRLLELMDALDDHRTDHEEEIKRLTAEKTEKQQAIDQFKSRIAHLDGEIATLESEKPKYLNEIEPSLKKKYARIHASLGSLAVTRIEDGSCGGCGTKLPPQVVVEIRSNNQLITCQACGRILIYYVD